MGRVYHWTSLMSFFSRWLLVLTNLFNYSLQHKVVSLAWKESHITPIYKGGAPDDPSNYRPITVVPVVAKLLEKIVATQLAWYVS